tara:strand:- start:156 stop:581 length:426 start_codon:yes stop_codon:yes gene_type:complete
MNILVINGPNLNMLGTREPEIYGNETLEELMMWLETSPEGVNHKFKFYQTNHEGTIIDTLQDECDWCDAVIINPGALAHYSYSIRDAIASISKPTVEVHLTDIQNREPFRNKSVISDVCTKMICGKGKNGYLEALKLVQTN